MYETSFDLKRRPFAATPDASCFLSAGPIQAALDELVVCVEQGQGIAVLTSPAGTGKTLLCERLRFELDERYEAILLRHASFLTRRALLQTILCELNHPYHHPSEQELRLELLPAIRSLQPKREALVLICDEAHQLTDSLLEELRILADFAESGRPLVRLVLVGQSGLEEKLVQPGLDAFNQRIRAHINLSPFDHAGSLDYIDYRITWAGGRTEEVFTPAALDLIAQASDGVPRCINQLADHTLLLAFVAEQRPAGEDLVHEALSDLRQLPLQWNEPLRTRIDSERLRDLPAPKSDISSGYLTQSAAVATTYSFEPVAESNEMHSHAGPEPIWSEHSISSDSNDFGRLQADSDDWRQTVELFNPVKSNSATADLFSSILSDTTAEDTSESDQPKMRRRFEFHSLLQDAYAAASDSKTVMLQHDSSLLEEPCESLNLLPSHSTIISANSPTDVHSQQPFQEEVIVDRYAMIDAGLQPPAQPLPDTNGVYEVRAEHPFVALTADQPTSDGKFSAWNDDDSDVRQNDGQGSGARNSPDATTDDLLSHVAGEVFSLGQSLQQAGSTDRRIDPPTYHDGASGQSWESIETPLPPPVVEARPFRYLFSTLRRKQQGLV